MIYLISLQWLLFFLSFGKVFNLSPNERTALDALQRAIPQQPWNTTLLQACLQQQQQQSCMTCLSGSITEIKCTSYLSGYIPTHIGYLSNLRILKLSYNNLKGTLPTQMGLLVQLTLLDLSSNSFEGTLPRQLRSLTLLNYMDLSSNTILGTIPTDIGNLSSLKLMKLSYNGLNGSLPTEIGLLANVTYLDLSNNHIYGTIPTTISGMNSLMILSFAANSITGPVPTQICHLSQLYWIDISKTQIDSFPSHLYCLPLKLLVMSDTGVQSIPALIGNFTYLEYLDVSRSRLYGTLPDELFSLTSLRTLLLSSNTNCTFPSTYSLTGLSKLDLSNTSFFGTFPNQILNTSTSLSKLSLARNPLLYGTLSSSLSNLTLLTYLDISGTTCTIPSLDLLQNLTRLNVLVLSFTPLSGTVPSELLGLPLIQLDLSSTLLTGPFPQGGPSPSFPPLQQLSLNDVPLSFPLSLLSSLKSLTYVSLRNNSISGTLNETFFFPPMIQYLDLGENKISGVYPNSLGMCKQLYYLNLTELSLSGTVPRQYGALAALRTIHLQAFEGCWPCFHNWVSFKSLTSCLTDNVTLHCHCPTNQNIQITKCTYLPCSNTSKYIAPCCFDPPTPNFVCVNGTWISNDVVLNHDTFFSGDVLVNGSLVSSAKIFLQGNLVITEDANMSDSSTLVLSDGSVSLSVLSSVNFKGTLSITFSNNNNFSLPIIFNSSTGHFKAVTVNGILLDPCQGHLQYASKTVALVYSTPDDCNRKEQWKDVYVIPIVLVVFVGMVVVMVVATRVKNVRRQLFPFRDFLRANIPNEAIP